MTIVKQLLAKIGIADDVAEKLVTGDENATKDINIDELVEGVKNGYLERFEADGTLDSRKNEAVNALHISRNKAFRDIAKKHGIVFTDAEYNALPTDKRSEALYDAILAKAKAVSGDKDDKDKTIAELHAELSKRDEEITKLRDEELPNALKSAEEKITSFKRELFLQEEFRKASKDGLIADESILWPGVKARLESEYDFIEKEGSFIPVKKGTTTQIFTDKNKPATLSDLMPKYVEPIIKKSEPAPITRIKDTDSPPKFNAPGAKRRDAALADARAQVEKK